ncbi:Glycogen debranching enzyme (alpha-1,6-glucosidase) [Pedococcus dokdonensis]|uniref:Glycogen debranching enzyme (Alpha-1,6-glucosidase) n=1 Tax=Pedococcus dokdonensis TaxID=443156 RepID=A0A1H0N541_9MICO|nr:glycogen debranching N-terminal domain-containing protein [Pedococcus dokdonensis]SDO87626.1 Glycogen debranching enzyme (alpha-1,6-glucosidase) [Pedococcus dokdonensis]
MSAAPSPRQPWLHDLRIIVDGNATALSATDGDVVPGTAQGLFVDDVRVLSRLELTVSGESPTPIASAASGAAAEFFGAARGLGDPGPDPTVEVHRVRTLEAASLVEQVTITSRAAEPVTATLRIELGSDGLDIAKVKYGVCAEPAVRPVLTDGLLTFTTNRHRTLVEVDPAATSVEALGDRAVLVHEVVVEPGASRTLRLTVTALRTAPSEFDADAGSRAVAWDDVRVSSDDPRLEALVARSVDDLRHLLLRDPLDPADVFAAAGSPWYLTLFGRDSIWAARMMLPFGTELAAGTLRALARRQGTRHDPESAEQPGKIAHEVRRTAYTGSPRKGDLALPPLYYGTVDATALWVTLLVEAWRWGLAEAQVRALLPHLRAALAWLTGDGQPDDDGFLKYLDATGHGLVNQGWKDSLDSMRTRDGRIAPAPIALVEAQAYAVQALLEAADLLDALGEEGAAEVRHQGAALRDRVRAAFWVGGADGRYLAMALDGQGRAVDGLGSNMGHALGTGTLDPGEAATVGRTVTGAELLDTFGVRTLGTGNGGFNPIGYHTGSIWTHDTAIVALGLAREGLGDAAAAVSRALVASAEAFDYRWPELYSGLPMMGRPAPYPASCRPQAWSAASAGAVVSVALGLRADLPRGVLHVEPPRPSPFGALRVDGLRLGATTFSVEVDRDGAVEVIGVPDEVEIRRGA